MPVYLFGTCALLSSHSCLG